MLDWVRVGTWAVSCFNARLGVLVLVGIFWILVSEESVGIHVDPSSMEDWSLRRFHNIKEVALYIYTITFIKSVAIINSFGVTSTIAESWLYLPTRLCLGADSTVCEEIASKPAVIILFSDGQYQYLNIQYSDTVVTFE